MAITRATLRIERELQALISEILDAQTRALVEAWVTAWDEVVADVEAAAADLVAAASTGRVTRTMVSRSQRAQAALEAVAGALDQVAQRTGVIITGDLHRLIQAAADADVDMTATQLTGARRADLAANLVRADAAQVAAMVQRATEQITALSLPVSAETAAAIRRELLRGIAVGDNPRAAARRMVRSVEDRFDGGLARALVISRTEMLDAARTAAMAAGKANADVLTGWVWVAELSHRTCPACVAMHGTEHGLDEPGPLGHQQCRCARVPKTKTWAELGFPGIQDPQDATPDAVAWFDGLSADVQKSILGPKRFEAWQRGVYPMSAWAARRHTAGWRDSYVPSRAPAAA